ncbi:MAG: glycosyltransferase family 2 protein [Methanobrevibacter sp.]|nr:glycosyltransferase family 2 protein [Methanobrevibacter sp.]
MKIAIDKNSLDAIKPGYEYIYLFDNEPLEDLLKTGLHCIRYDKCDFVDINLTDYKVNCLKQATLQDNNYDKLPERKDFKIGIIVPNCNYADCLEKCLGSILKQTYKNFEIIFVDDMSTDNSLEIAKRLLKPPHKVIALKQKRLNGGARNEAYLCLSEDVDYVYYVDSDDWLYDNTALEQINYYLQSRPDVLFVGLAQYKAGKTTPIYAPNYQSRIEAIKGWSGSCGKVIEKNLATRQECLYCEGTLKEDRNQHCKVCIYMNSFKNLPKPIYVWNRENHKSVTTIRDKIIWGTSTIRHYADTLQLYLSEKGKDPQIDRYLEERVRMTKQEMEGGGDKQW